MRVRCIEGNNKGEVGDITAVDLPQPGFFTVIFDKLGGLHSYGTMSYFEVLDFELSPKGPPIPAKPRSDAEFFAAVRSGNCPCNLPRSSCGYHR